MNDSLSLSRRLYSALLLALGLMIGFGLAASISRADQPPPDSADMPPPPREGGRGDRQRPEHPLLKVFDTNHDGQLDAAEVAAASAVLRAYDSNSDGSLDLKELLAALPPPPRGPGMAMAHGRERGGDLRMADRRPDCS